MPKKLMQIGIDGSRAFIKNRTGIEEYSYRVIEGLKKYLQKEQVVLYLRKNQVVDFELPKNWKIKVINFSRFWTQIGLSLEMLHHPVDVLFIPAHTVPIIHPEKTIVTIHGLEYEFCRQSYSFLERIYMRVSIKNSCRWAKEIISVSENTKKDLINLYDVSAEKINVIHEGYFMEHAEEKKCSVLHDLCFTPFLLFVGRIEERKNIANIIRAFEILKERYKIPHKLVLAGRPGYKHENIKDQLTNSVFHEEIHELGFISDEKKFELMRRADAFVFPTLYEGFGIPILEAQSVGCPVVASNNSSIPEVSNGSALLVDPSNPEDIAENIFNLISNERLRHEMVIKGLENAKRFSWDKCAQKISDILSGE